MTIDEEEVQAAVSKIVPGFVRYAPDSTGNRLLGRTFDDFRNAALGAFLSRRNAPFYVVLLGRDRLVERLSSLKERVEELERLVVSTGRRVQPVSKMSSLTNARAALDALASSVAERTGVYQRIADIPSFRRFESNVNQFLKEEGRKTRFRQELVDTPQQARERIRPLAVELRNEWDALLQHVQLWVGSIDAYSSLNLPASLSQAVIRNASDILRGRAEELNALSPEERLSVLRSVVVDLVAIKSTVRGFGSLEPPTTFALLSGEAALYSDETHPASSARLVSDKGGGYSVLEGQDTLSLLVDGAHSLSIPLPGSFVARHNNQQSLLSLVTNTADTLRFSITRNQGSGLSTVINDVSIPASDIYMSQAVAAINAQATDVEAGVFHIIPKTTQEVMILDDGFGSYTITSTVPLLPFGVSIGDTVIITDSSSSYYNTVFSITGTGIGGELNASVVGSTTGTGFDQTTASFGKPEDVRHYVQLVDKQDALETRAALQLVDVTPGTWASFGFFPGAQVESVRTTAEVLAQYINESTYSATLDGVARVSAELEDSGVIHSSSTLLGRTHPEDPFLLTLYWWRGEASITAKTPSTTTFSSAELAAVSSVGSRIVVRGTTSPADTDLVVTVIAVSGSQVTVNAALVESSTAFLEAGPDLYDLTDKRAEVAVVIGGDGENTGRYPASSRPPSSPFTLRLSKALPFFIDLGGQPVLLPSVSLVEPRLVLVSQSTSLSAAVAVTGAGSFDSQLVEGGTKTARGTTAWVQLADGVRGIENGDILELHTTDALTPTRSSRIRAVDTEARLLELETPIPSDQTPFQVAVTSTLPFARIRKVVKQNFDEVASQAADWLKLPLNEVERSFRLLDAGLNPVLANASPTMAQINTPRMQLRSMYSYLEQLEELLSQYSTDVVEEVDSLIRGYLQKGMDRAVDVLLSGDFTTFFGMDISDVSYASYLQKSLRDVQKDDFPVRRDNRVNAVDAADEQIVAQFEDVDFEYTPDSLDPVQRVDISEPSSPLYNLPTP